MPYAEGRVVHDADAHVMETPDWLVPYADPGVRERLKPLFVSVGEAGRGAPHRSVPAARTPIPPTGRASRPRSCCARTGARWARSSRRTGRARSICSGFRSQLVFNTFLNKYLVRRRARRRPRPRLRRGARPQPRHGRLLQRRPRGCSRSATCRSPTSRAHAPWPRKRSRMGCKALLVPSACPPGHSPSHVGLFPVWAVGAGSGRCRSSSTSAAAASCSSRSYFDNGLPPVADFHGGAENFRSVDYMAIPFPPMQTLATMIFDGVLDRFPRLKVGVIEQGAVWLPSWMRQLDTAFEAFAQERGAAAQARAPAERVRAPSDPRHALPDRARRLDHRAGRPGGLPVLVRLAARRGRTQPDQALRGEPGRRRRSGAAQRFYCDNFVDLMGAGLPAPLRAEPQPAAADHSK